MTPKYIIPHHSESMASIGNRQFKAIEALHKQLFNMKSTLGFYTGYQYLIEWDGTVIQTRADTETGAHTIGRNNDSIGICLAGNFDKQMPSDDQISALKTLLLRKMKEYNIPAQNILPHRYFATSTMKNGVFVKNTSKYKTWDGCLPYKSCYGSNLPDNWGQLLVAPPPQVVAVEDVDKAIGILGRLIKLLQDYLAQRVALGLPSDQRHEAA